MTRIDVDITGYRLLQGERVGPSQASFMSHCIRLVVVSGRLYPKRRAYKLKVDCNLETSIGISDWWFIAARTPRLEITQFVLDLLEKKEGIRLARANMMVYPFVGRIPP